MAPGECINRVMTGSLWLKRIAGRLVLLAVTSCAGMQVPVAQITSPGEALFNGRVKADVNCYSCHNGDGAGTWRGPDLAKRIPKLTDQQIAAAVAEGPGLMPAFKDKLTDAEVREIIPWLRQRFPR
jgi:mono/diheme cytochrome c family protein